MLYAALWIVYAAVVVVTVFFGLGFLMALPFVIRDFFKTHFGRKG